MTTQVSDSGCRVVHSPDYRLARKKMALAAILMLDPHRVWRTGTYSGASSAVGTQTCTSFPERHLLRFPKPVTTFASDTCIPGNVSDYAVYGHTRR
ncbi:MAG: hypothetical protein OXU81_23960, partial [Gammaproteobacteria bacterium]|nr:hypothetical protein [Gammaproteobacteria bacterium]